MLDQQQTRDAGEHIRELILALMTDNDELSDRASDWGLDGYPSSSGFERTTPSTEFDDDGHPVPHRTDPVGRTVARRVDHPQANPMRAQRDETRAFIARVRREAEALHGRNIAALRPPADNSDLEPECPSCRAAGVWERVLYRAGFCRFCYEWRLSHKMVNPPRKVVTAKHFGTRRDLTRAIRDHERDQQRTPRRRKTPAA